MVAPSIRITTILALVVALTIQPLAVFAFQTPCHGGANDPESLECADCQCCKSQSESNDARAMKASAADCCCRDASPEQHAVSAEECSQQILHKLESAPTIFSPSTAAGEKMRWESACRCGVELPPIQRPPSTSQTEVPSTVRAFGELTIQQDRPLHAGALRPGFFDWDPLPKLGFAQRQHSVWRI